MGAHSFKVRATTTDREPREFFVHVDDPIDRYAAAEWRLLDLGWSRGDLNRGTIHYRLVEPDTVEPPMPAFADVVEHEGHEIVVQPIGRGPTVVQIVCVECSTVLVEVDNPATREGLSDRAADALAELVIADAEARGYAQPAHPCVHTEEAPRPLADLVADALDVVERCAELDYATAQIAAPALSWQMQRLARQVAELAQHVDARDHLRGDV